MILRHTRILIAFCCLGFASGAAAYTPGDIYTGEVLAQDANGIRLNTTPCKTTQSEVSIKFFHVSRLGLDTCPGPHGRTYQKVQVEEIPPTTKPGGKP
jgi:hypothetical protein